MASDLAGEVRPAGHDENASAAPLQEACPSSVDPVIWAIQNKLFLTATPPNGYPESFTALLHSDHRAFLAGWHRAPLNGEDRHHLALRHIAFLD